MSFFFSLSAGSTAGARHFFRKANAAHIKLFSLAFHDVNVTDANLEQTHKQKQKPMVSQNDISDPLKKIIF